LARLARFLETRRQARRVDGQSGPRFLRTRGGVSFRDHDKVRAMLKRTLVSSFLVFGISLSQLVVTGCGGGQPKVLTADHIQAAAMPAGGEWKGVYFNQTFGFLHVTTSGQSAQGSWRTAAGDKWGELYGEFEGDVLKYSWTEYKVGVVGPNAKSEGKGYFKYIIPTEGEAHELKGEWGLGENAVGHSWDCVKQMNQEPDPASVRPNEMESAIGAQGFDGAKGDTDLEEKPAETDAPKDGEKKDDASDPL